MKKRLWLSLALAYPLMLHGAAHAADAKRPWLDSALTPDARAEQLVKAMTLDEKIQTVFGYFSTDFESKKYLAPKEGRKDSAGFIPGIERLGLPAQWQSDAGVGVATQGAYKERPLERTALPSGLAIAASWDPALAERGGAMIGAEARASGFNVMLAGGVNLNRDPRNGRTFEYGGEDPLLAGMMAGAAARGIQSNHIVSTIKHYALNDQETGRGILNAVIDQDAAVSLGGATYHVVHPGGRAYERPPINANEAEGRRASRFEPRGHTPGAVDVAAMRERAARAANPDYPRTLDLRRTLAP